MAERYALPRLSLRFVHIWRRNRLVWRKLAIPSMLGNLADPMLYMLGLGYGLGAMLPEVGGMPYIAFLAAGTVCSSTMMSASFEAMYASFSRMHVQRTWDAIMNAPVTLDDVVLGEAVWAASKSLLSGIAVLAVAWALGLTQFALAWLWANRIVTSVIAGPRTFDQWRDYVSALGTKWNDDDEELVDSLVAPGHPSKPGYSDPQYPFFGRMLD